MRDVGDKFTAHPLQPANGGYILQHEQDAGKLVILRVNRYQIQLKQPLLREVEGHFLAKMLLGPHPLLNHLQQLILLLRFRVMVTDQLLGRDAEHLLCPSVHDEDNSIAIDHDDAVYHVIKDALELILILLNTRHLNLKTICHRIYSVSEFANFILLAYLDSR
ncbi:hypothetical protein D3C78_669900 [compost metagenome]